MAVSDELLKELAVMGQGRVPVFSSQPTIENGGEPGPPANSATDGINVANSLVTTLRVQLRANASYRTSTITIDTLDTASEYKVTIGGTAVTYDAASDTTTTTVATGLPAALEANGTVAALVTSTSEGNVITIVGDAAANYSIAVAIVGGSGTMTLSAEATSVTFRVWAVNKGQSQFDLINEYSTKTITENWTDKLVTSGYERLFMECTATNGKAIFAVGPAGLES